MEAAQVRAEKKGLSGSALKMIAMVTMLIDHIGASLIENGMMQKVVSDSVLDAQVSSLQHYTMWFAVDKIMRGIGRISFPIFCFLLVEGFLHTRNWKKYALRLFLFGVISEIPFDLAFFKEVLNFSHQNVFFTLFIGMLVLAGLRCCEQRENFLQQQRRIMEILTIVVGMAAAQLLHTDYGAFGVFAIAGLYFFRENKTRQTIFGCVAFLWEGTAPLAFLPIHFYNGERGLNLKYVFYVFYPAHLLILGLLTKFCF